MKYRAREQKLRIFCCVFKCRREWEREDFCISCTLGTKYSAVIILRMHFPFLLVVKCKSGSSVGSHSYPRSRSQKVPKRIVLSPSQQIHLKSHSDRFVAPIIWGKSEKFSPTHWCTMVSFLIKSAKSVAKKFGARPKLNRAFSRTCSLHDWLRFITSLKKVERGILKVNWHEICLVRRR